MLSKKVFCLYAFANSVCLSLGVILNPRTLLAKDGASEEGILDRGNTLSSFLDSSLPLSLFQKINEDNLMSFSETLLFSVVLIFVFLFLWYLKKPRQQTITEPCFKIINITEQSYFVPLRSEIQTLEFLSEIETQKKYRLSSNLNKVIMTPHKESFLLEDKNFKNALLINRRRSHRKILFNNDILDVGEMVLLYCNNIFDERKALDEKANHHQAFSDYKPKGPIPKGSPILAIAGCHQEIPLLRNINTLGTSNFNDIIIKSNEVALRHAKIYKVGKSWKIQNIQNYETTMVNGRRIDQRVLKDGDEVSIGDFFFKFIINKVQIKRLKKIKKEKIIKSAFS